MVESRNERILKSATSRLDRIRALNAARDADSPAPEHCMPQKNEAILEQVEIEETSTTWDKRLPGVEAIPISPAFPHGLLKRNLDMHPSIEMEDMPLKNEMDHDSLGIHHQLHQKDKGLLPKIMKRFQMLLLSILLWEFLVFVFHFSSFKATTHEWIFIFSVVFLANKNTLPLFKAIYSSLICTILGGLIVNSIPVFTLINH